MLSKDYLNHKLTKIWTDLKNILIKANYIIVKINTCVKII